MDFTAEEIRYLLDLADNLKDSKRAGRRGRLLDGKNICIIFEKTSTRTRCSFEVAAYDEGAHATFLTNSQMGKKESVEDTARVLGRLYDGIEFRGYSQTTVEQLARHAGVPVWNGLTDQFHPTQILADLMTARERINKPFHKMKLAYLGDGRNNMANSLMNGSSIMGMDMAIVAPKSLFPDAEVARPALEEASRSGSRIIFTENVDEGVLGADIIYTDVWCSMGEEAQMDSRIKLLRPYQVTEEVMAKTGNPDAIFLHCLPAFHDTNTETGQYVFEKYGLKEMEVTDAVFRGRQSFVFDQAENRMHTIKAIMVATIGNCP
jgi:ornithine carbamoyltransferase